LLELVKKIEELVRPLLAPWNAFIVEVFIRQGHQRKTVQIFADTDAGITIDQCAKISRELAVILEEQNIIEDAFDLEVSSPGLDKPLKLLRQYQRNIKRPVKVKFKNGDEIVNIEGIIEAVQGNQIICETKQHEQIVLEFEQIVETTVKLPW
jgi:ribosome maturation factor RimP